MPYKDPQKTRIYNQKYGPLYHQKNKERINMAHRIRHKEIKTLVFDHYGWKCKCCGESHKEFLTIDHIYGDGNKHRKQGIKTNKIYYWLIKNNFPKEFQTLCFNCNCSNGHFGYCPHEKEVQNVKYNNSRA